MGFISRHPIIVSAVFFILTLQLISIRLGERETKGVLSTYVLTLNYYPEMLISGTARSIVSVWSKYIDLLEVGEENSRLKARIRERQNDRFALTEAMIENKRLRRLLGFKERSSHPLLPVTVIGSSPSLSRSKLLVVDRGKGDGVLVGMPVATDRGAVGRVLVTGGRVSEVMLITDELSAVDAYVQRTRARGVVKGTGGGCVMEYLEGLSDVSVDDVVVSSGKDGFFPKGVVIGTVGEVGTIGGDVRAVVVPAADLDSLEEAVIILKSPGYVFKNE
ncbi:MAG: rod shape-determining protein MreC [Candidatus Dadabacteria bacterium]|nr:rod shape-determining protein MreC [Candidatus Dadabacteria bacterium]